jgi:hypothetical protein
VTTLSGDAAKASAPNTSPLPASTYSSCIHSGLDICISASRRWDMPVDSALTPWLEDSVTTDLLLGVNWLQERIHAKVNGVKQEPEKSWAGLYEDNGSCLLVHDDIQPDSTCRLQVIKVPTYPAFHHAFSPHLTSSHLTSPVMFNVDPDSCRRSLSPTVTPTLKLRCATTFCHLKTKSYTASYKFAPALSGPRLTGHQAAHCAWFCTLSNSTLVLISPS